MANYERGARNFFGSINSGINDRLKDVSTLGPLFRGEDMPRNFDSDGNAVPDSDIGPVIRQNPNPTPMLDDDQIAYLQSHPEEVEQIRTSYLTAMAKSILGVSNAVSRSTSVERDRFNTLANFGHLSPQQPIIEQETPSPPVVHPTLSPPSIPPRHDLPMPTSQSNQSDNDFPLTGLLLILGLFALRQ